MYSLVLNLRVARLAEVETNLAESVSESNKKRGGIIILSICMQLIIVQLTL
jgi:hypothetical protein